MGTKQNCNLDPTITTTTKRASVQKSRCRSLITKTHQAAAHHAVAQIRGGNAFPVAPQHRVEPALQTAKRHPFGVVYQWCVRRTMPLKELPLLTPRATAWSPALLLQSALAASIISPRLEHCCRPHATASASSSLTQHDPITARTRTRARNGACTRPRLQLAPWAIKCRHFLTAPWFF